MILIRFFGTIGTINFLPVIANIQNKISKKQFRATRILNADFFNSYKFLHLCTFKTPILYNQFICI
jgi:hypothetical protein